MQEEMKSMPQVGQEINSRMIRANWAQQQSVDEELGEIEEFEEDASARAQDNEDWRTETYDQPPAPFV